MEKATSVVCICDTHEQSQRATKDLQKAGIDSEALSLATGDVSTSEQGLDDYLLGDQTFPVPGIGPLLIHGPLASWMASASSSGAAWHTSSVLGTGLATLGISGDSILEYEAALRSGKFLLLFQGSPNEVARAVKVIGGTTHCSHTVHGETVFDTVHSGTPQVTSTYFSQA